MELFEILFILMFILIPLFEGIRKSRQRPGPEQDEAEADAEAPVPSERPFPTARPGQRTGPPRDAHRPGPVSPSEQDAETDPEPAQAADMLPDDLWAVLTGEQRERPPPVEAEPEPWSDEPASARHDAGPVEPERFEPAPWVDDTPAPQPPIRDRPEPVPTPHDEWRQPAPPVDHRREPERPPRRRRAPLREVQVEIHRPRRQSDLIRALQGGASLRQAVLLREVLGPPKGLDR